MWKFPSLLMIKVNQLLLVSLEGRPGGASGKESSYLRDTGSLWVGKVPWRRAWQPTPVFLPGESHGQRGLVGSRVTRSRTRLSDLAHARTRCLWNPLRARY